MGAVPRHEDLHVRPPAAPDAAHPAPRPRLGPGCPRAAARQVLFVALVSTAVAQPRVIAVAVATSHPAIGGRVRRSGLAARARVEQAAVSRSAVCLAPRRRARLHVWVAARATAGAEARAAGAAPDQAADGRNASAGCGALRQVERGGQRAAEVARLLAGLVCLQGFGSQLFSGRE